MEAETSQQFYSRRLSPPVAQPAAYFEPVARSFTAVSWQLLVARSQEEAHAPAPLWPDSAAALHSSNNKVIQVKVKKRRNSNRVVKVEERA